MYIEDGSLVLRYRMLSAEQEWIDSISGVLEKIDS